MRRVNQKFKVLYDSMQELYLQRNEKNQKITKRILYLLNIILSAGIIKDFFDELIGIQDPSKALLSIIATSIIGFMLIATITYVLFTGFKTRITEKGYTADAVITDETDNIVLIKRKFPPYKGKYALPGGFVKYSEDPRQAVIREVREETNLIVEAIKKIGTYDQKNRDPRGRIISNAYKCRILKGVERLEGGDDATAAELIPIKRLKEMDLAFDHKQILKDAGVL
jgi:8-oxo-dGTP diphosphatase